MKKYQLIDSKQIYSGIVFDVQLDTVVIPSGKTVTRDLVIHGGAVVIAPQTKNNDFLLVKQYRHAVGKTILEFPAGTLEKDESPLNCAERELIEEVGHKGRNWVSLGEIYSAPGFTNEILHIFWATDLSPDSAAGDEDEIIEVVTLSEKEIKAAINSGEILDAKTIAAFYRYLLKSEDS